MTDYTFYGFINLDWTIQWVDSNTNNSNNAVFKNGPTLPGTYTTYTHPTDSSGGGTVKPQFYNGTLDKIRLYSNTGGYVTTQSGGGTFYPIEMVYNTMQYGNYFFDTNKNLVYLNLDTIRVSDLYIPTGSGGTKLISDFSVKFDLYKTLYESNFNYNLTRTNGCRIYDDYKISETTTSGSYEYKLYIGNGIEIPKTLRDTFDINYEESLNIFTNIKSNAVVGTANPYWKNFMNYYGNPNNTGWIIGNIKSQ